MAEQVVGGVDFSGARQVPNPTWLALGKLDWMGLEIFALRQVGSHQLACELAAVRGMEAVGLDFPFSLPVEFLKFLAEKTGRPPFQAWEEIVEALLFMSLDDFLEAVTKLAHEPKRVTDTHYKRLAQSPLHRGYPSMVQMTYQGMRLLAGLDPARFSVLPFHDRAPDTCAVLEVFPRGTLAGFGLPTSGYKGKEKKERDKVYAVRSEILSGLIELKERQGAAFKDYPRLSVDNRLRHLALDSDDALDAVIACYTTALWVAAPSLFADPFDSGNEDVLLEGWAYVPVRSASA